MGRRSRNARVDQANVCSFWGFDPFSLIFLRFSAPPLEQYTCFFHLVSFTIRILVFPLFLTTVCVLFIHSFFGGGTR